jgi:hypothetical protein
MFQRREEHDTWGDLWNCDGFIMGCLSFPREIFATFYLFINNRISTAYFGRGPKKL